jgi:hypothetical protein
VRRSRLTFVPELRIEEIAAYHNDVIDSLDLYFSPSSQGFTTRFWYRPLDDVIRTWKSRHVETNIRSALTVMTSLEAYFRADFDLRCRRRLKDDLSVHFRQIERERRSSRVPLDDILEGWKRHGNVPQRAISYLRGAFKFRHWVAHGRYWPPKLGHPYDFEGVHDSAKEVISWFQVEFE